MFYLVTEGYGRKVHFLSRDSRSCESEDEDEEQCDLSWEEDSLCSLARSAPAVVWLTSV